MTHDQRIEWKRRLNHQCVRCGIPVHVGVLCDEHRIKQNRTFQRNYLLTRLKTVVAEGVLTREEVLKAIPRRRFTSDPA